MRPLDPRLLRHAQATRSYVIVSVALGVLTTLLVISQAWLLAVTISGAVAGGKNLDQLRDPIAVLLVVFLGRAGVAWAVESSAHRSSAKVKSQLRAALLERMVTVGAQTLTVGPQTPTAYNVTGDLVTLVTRGIDALDGYFSRYLPQLVLAVIVPPTLVAVILSKDWIAAVIVAVTIPLIPLFMVLIGAATQRRADRQFRTLQRLSGHFLDLVSGLPTLKIFGQARSRAQSIREVTDRYRRTTMAVLRVTFLSSLVLELLATLSVALVAVSVGMRLLNGHVTLRTALFVLLLAPEVFQPLRLVGANFHANAEGMSAAEQIFECVESPLPRVGRRADLGEIGDTASASIVVDRVRVIYPRRAEPALDELSLNVEPGEILALAGPSGCGKSTLLAVLLGFIKPQAGSVRVCSADREIDIADMDPDVWRERLAWVPQRPHLFASSIADNVRLGRPDSTDEEVAQALADAGLTDVLAMLPEGMRTLLGELGVGLSAGERQRVALARAFLRDVPILLLDEPTANLDGATELEVLDAVKRLARDRTVVLVAHRPALLAMADRVLFIARPAATAI